MKVTFRNKLESFVRCEEQLWPDCGGPSTTFLPPHAFQGGKATQTYFFLLAENSVQFHDVRWVRESNELGGREAVSGTRHMAGARGGRGAPGYWGPWGYPA